MNPENENSTNLVIKKRGRKSKKELELNKLNKNVENIVVNIEDNINNDVCDSNILIQNFFNIVDDEQNKLDCNDNNSLIDNNDIQINSLIDNKPITKKRGRKPKGGKIIQQILPINDIKENRPNVILHLKCLLKDLNENVLFSSKLDSFNFSNDSLTYENVNNSETVVKPYSKKIDDEIEYDSEKDYEINKNNDIREIWKKLKVLENDLHHNNITNQKCYCFHDTCEFDNPPIYIPKCYINGSYQVYGCFCSPECAVSYLMNEHIDTSIKFERYYLLNHIYSKIFEYKKNIKPAADPYYMLDKYYGNLTIQEYRSLLRNERLFLVVDKPLTRIMPELHEDNDDFIINNKIIPSNTYKIKKRLHQKNTKNNILNERFGLTT